MTVAFSTAVSDYVSRHLPARQCSPNTIRSYCAGLASFIEFAAADLGKQPGDIKPGEISAERCARYTESLTAAGLSPSSVNQRIACLKSFMLYISRRDVSYLADWRCVEGMKGQKAKEPLITWLSVEEMRMLLAIPDARSESGLRDLAVLALLYDSAARVQELCDLRVGDFDRHGRTITLTGKGRKTRTVPIGKATCKILTRYLAGRGSQAKESPLVTNARGTKLSTSGVRYVINKYVEEANGITGSDRFSRKVTPHVFRHSKAMHLLEAGVELIYIRDFLGHVSVTTTEVYAKASPEAKRRAIERRGKSLDIGPKRFSKTREEGIVEQLKAIGRKNSPRADSKTI